LIDGVVEKGLPVKDRCWRRASKEKEMWRPSKSEDTDRFFSKNHVRFSSGILFLLKNKKKEKIKFIVIAKAMKSYAIMMRIHKNSNC
jgi:hypothetical protein